MKDLIDLEFKSIIMSARGGALASDCQKEAIKVSLDLGAEVVFDHNDQLYRIDGREALSLVKLVPKKPD